jgi:hypothetical protein
MGCCICTPILNYDMDIICNMSFDELSIYHNFIINDGYEKKDLFGNIFKPQYSSYKKYKIYFNNLEYNKDNAYILFKNIYNEYNALQQIKILLLFIVMKCNVTSNFINKILYNLSLCTINKIKQVIDEKIFYTIISIYPSNKLFDYILLNHSEEINNICIHIINKNKYYYYVNILSFLTFNENCIDNDIIENVIIKLKEYIYDKKYNKNIFKYLNYENIQKCKIIFYNNIEFLQYLCINSDLEEVYKNTFITNLTN